MSLSLFTSEPYVYTGGGIAAGIPVSVFFQSTAVRVTLYKDDLGIVRESNPLPTEDDGTVSFWVEPGTYDLVALGVRTTVVVAPIPDPPGPDDYVTRTEVESMIAAAGGGLLPSIVAKGDLYAGSAPNTVGLLSIGTSGQILSADPASAVGLRWTDAAGGGSGAVTSVNGKTGVVVLNTSDVGAEPVITAGNASQYWRGDKSWQTLDKTAVGLASVNNTSDAAKPISTATQTALDAKADAAVTTTALAGKQPLDSDLTTVAGLTPTNSDTLQYIAGAWANRTPSQVKITLAITEADVANLTTDLAAKQPLDSDLTTIAGLTSTTDNMIQGVAGAWASRTPAQVKTALAIAQSDVSGLTAALALLAPLASPTLTGTVTVSGRFIITPDTITISAGNADTDASLGNHFKIAANANFTLTNPTNSTDGQRIMWQITQDGTGSRTITLGSAFALGTDITAVTLTTTANKSDYLGAVYDSTAAKWRVVMFVRGY
jgi:hypothetical protein